ncbi:MAG: ribokinase [Firmicutes bacterium HGW-Firmicutes-7]|nr:MAG: ribokinase [Firmicutes bacterium HGW-Firmicutes-7]
MKIINFGSLNIDNVYRVDRLVLSGNTIDSKGYKVFSGGKGLNQSVAISKAGVSEVYHVGNIGMNGEFLMYTLLEHGINTDFIKRSSCKTGHAVIQVADNAEHTIIIHGGSNHNIDIDFIDSVLQEFQAGDLLLLQNEINNVGYIIDTAYEKGLVIILNPAPANEKILEYDLSKIDTLIVNESELYQCARTNHLKDAIDIIRQKGINLLLTLGCKGGIYYSKDHKEYKYLAYKVDEVDTTAIGDAFVGYFVAGLTKYDDMTQILDLSSRAAALTATNMGASNSIPSLDEVLSFNKEGKNCYED